MPGPPFHSVADVRRAARRRLPRVVFEYICGGAEDEVTMRANEQAFRSIAFAPRMGVEAGAPVLGTTVLGGQVGLPVLLAPCGLVRLMHPDGALGAARAATAHRTVSVLSTVAGAAPEALAGMPGRRWFQLYAAGGRTEAASLTERAAAAGFEALVVTVDTPALGNRERDVRNGVTPPLRLSARSAVRLGPQVLARPGWTVRMLRDGVRMLGRPEPAPGVPPGGDGGADGVGGALSAAGTVSMLASPFTWADVEWLRARWGGPLVVKGLLSARDARRAVEAGADAVVVSNHGGRQLDGAPATVSVLPSVVDAVGGRAEVLVDGGVRRGGDVVKALALGARAVLVGRPYLYGLAAAGERGVGAVLGILEEEMRRTMTLLGCPDVSVLDRSWLGSATLEVGEAGGVGGG